MWSVFPRSSPPFFGDLADSVALPPAPWQGPATNTGPRFSKSDQMFPPKCPFATSGPTRHLRVPRLSPASASLTATGFSLLTAPREASHPALPPFIYSTNTYRVPMMHRALLQALRGQANKTELCPQGVHALAGEREHRSPRQTGEMGASAGDVPLTARGL